MPSRASGYSDMNYGKQVSLNGVMAGVFGVLAFLFLVAEVILLGVGDGALWIYTLGHAAVLCGLASATLSIREFFLAARERERKCFETGRQVGRAESSPGGRDLHSVS